MDLQSLPIGDQGFASLRGDNYLYVDKTELIYRMIQKGKFYFLSRPRRFGKSLLLSTIEAYFQGKRELFNDLYIATKEQEWAEHPVLHLDFSTQNYKSEQNVYIILNDFLDEYEAKYGRKEGETDVALRFKWLAKIAISDFVKDILDGNVEQFLLRLQSFFADFQYDAQTTPESHFRNVLYILCKLMGLQVDAEYQTSDGRIDLLLRTDKFVYIIECKIDSTARIALDQIKDKEYALPWSLDNREKILIGLNFSTTTRRPDDWIIERGDGTIVKRGDQETGQVAGQVQELIQGLKKKQQLVYRFIAENEPLQTKSEPLSSENEPLQTKSEPLDTNFIATRLGLPYSTAKRITKQLEDLHLIRRAEGKKNGSWEIERLKQ